MTLVNVYTVVVASRVSESEYTLFLLGILTCMCCPRASTLQWCISKCLLLPLPMRLFYPAFVCLIVCLFVCLQLHVKTADRILIQILPEMQAIVDTLDREKLITFCKSSAPGSGHRNLSKDSSSLRVRTFSTIWFSSV